MKDERLRNLVRQRLSNSNYFRVVDQMVSPTIKALENVRKGLGQKEVLLPVGVTNAEGGRTIPSIELVHRLHIADLV